MTKPCRESREPFPQSVSPHVFRCGAPIKTRAGSTHAASSTAQILLQVFGQIGPSPEEQTVTYKVSVAPSRPNETNSSYCFWGEFLSRLVVTYTTSAQGCLSQTSLPANEGNSVIPGKSDCTFRLELNLPPVETGFFTDFVPDHS